MALMRTVGILVLFTRVGLGEEDCWTALTEGSEDFQWSKKMKLRRRECVRKRNWKDACDVYTFCWPTSKCHKRDSCQFFCVASQEGEPETGEVLGVPSRPELP